MVSVGNVDKIEELSEWYKVKQSTYQLLAEKVEILIRDILNKNNIKFHSINSRAKEIDSLLEKAKYKEYQDPIKDIKDYAGIRIIAFVKSDVDKICELIKPEFLIDELNSVDKGEELGEDKVGYRSVHYIASFNSDRLVLTEYASFEGMFFEIQIRTILEHAWADISHDRTYKFKNSLPEKNDIKRRFALAAATLELVDIEFDRLAKEIEEYSNEVKKDTELGELNYPIDSTSLESYVSTKLNYPRSDKDTKMFALHADTIIKEYISMGVTNLKELDSLINSIEEEKLYYLNENMKNTIVLLRSILMTSDPEKYFNDGWTQSWGTIGRKNANQLEVVVPNLTEYLKKNGIKINEPEEK